MASSDFLLLLLLSLYGTLIDQVTLYRFSYSSLINLHEVFLFIFSPLKFPGNNFVMTEIVMKIKFLFSFFRLIQFKNTNFVPFRI